MKTFPIIAPLFPIFILFFALPPTSNSLHAESEAAAAADANGEAIKAILKELDGEIERLDELKNNAPTQEEKAAAKTRIDALKERRRELRKTYIQSRYDALRADVKAEYDRLSQWTKKSLSRNPAANATVGSANTDIDSYNQNPSAENKAAVKASLDDLDTEIVRLETRVDNMPSGSERDSAKLRVKALKDRRSELASDFRKARYEALKADVKLEWDNMTR
jgi:hypothetical protein